MDEVETVVVGAGVIGLAIARRLARAGGEVLILEKEAAIGQHTSSRNSGVIHAGIYYPKGSLQGRLCLAGKAMLYDYCRTRHVGHERCGKYTLAPDAAGLGELGALIERARANGLHDLRIVGRAELAEREPAVVAAGAMLSPSSGIVDPVALMASLLGEAESAGAMLALGAPFASARRSGGGYEVSVGDVAATRLRCRRIVNAAALGAWEVARAVEGIDPASIPGRNLAKGSYFALSGRAPFSALIYPMPKPGSLGIHSVPDLGGAVRFGPNMEWVDRVDYAVDPGLGAEFERSVRSYWPGLPEGALHPDSAGIRPRIWGPGEAKEEFVLKCPADHGLPGLVSLFGFESPGLTACLAIAREVQAALA